MTEVSLATRVVENQRTLLREEEGPDSDFSLEPEEFAEMVRAVRKTEKAIGEVHYETTEKDSESETFRRSLFVVEDVEEREPFTADNVKSIRPGDGLAPKHLKTVLNGVATRNLTRGTPLSRSAVGSI